MHLVLWASRTGTIDEEGATVMAEIISACDYTEFQTGTP